MRTPKPAFSCLTLDMGADSIRLMEVSLTGNGPRMREIHRFSNLHVIRNGFDCWDLDHIRSGIGKGLHLAREAGGIHPLSIGVDSWGVDTIWMEESGRVSAPPVSYRDQRTRDMPRLWAERMSEVETFRRTGIQSTAFNTLYQLLAQKLNGGWPDACRLLFIPSYINYLLSGHIHNELTIASTSQLLQARGRQWDEEILRLLDLEPGRLGEVIPPGTHLGPVRWPGAPHMETVAVCGHDTACVVAALPPEEEGRAFLVAGTWCILGVERPDPILTDAARNLGFTNERAYPDRYRVLKNLVGLWLVQGLRRSWMDEPTYEGLDREAAEAGQVRAVVDPEHPLFFNPPDMKDAFDRFFRGTGQPIPRSRGAYVQCAYNSLACALRYHVEALEGLFGKRIRSLHVVGGGSRSDYLRSRLASVCRRDVVRGPAEAAVLGNFLVQALAQGVLDNLREARECISGPGQTVQGPSQDSDGEVLYARYLDVKNRKHQNTHNEPY